MMNDRLSIWADRWKGVDERTVTESTPQILANEIIDWTIEHEVKLGVSKCKEL